MATLDSMTLLGSIFPEGDYGWKKGSGMLWAKDKWNFNKATKDGDSKYLYAYLEGVNIMSY